jgi:hypothetical protein
LTNEHVALLQESGLFDEIPESVDGMEVLQEECTTDAEHVLVSGASMEAVNGVYIKIRDQQQEEEETMYVTSSGDYALYWWNKTWHIAATCDLSNSLYQCIASQEQVPSSGWKSVGADTPAPTCTWKAATSVGPP